ncbi:MAG: ligase 1, partial [Rhodospirillaceae bacterium]|nr:ligase 1 [Rhodospirillaceae bacterium]
MLLGEVAAASADVAATSSRRTKVELLSSVLATLRPEEVPIAVAYLSGVLPQGSIGVGWASLKDLPPPGPPPAVLELIDVDTALRGIGAMAGAGSQAARRTALHDLFARATAAEQDYLRGLLMGEIRQGALEGVMVDAVSRAADVPLADVRRAAMLTG